MLNMRTTKDDLNKITEVMIRAASLNRADHSTSGRKVSRGPRTIWLRKTVP